MESIYNNKYFILTRGGFKSRSGFTQPFIPPGAIQWVQLVSRGKVKPPGVAPWLYRSHETKQFWNSHETEQFDDIVLRPKAEVSAVWDLFTFLSIRIQ